MSALRPTSCPSTIYWRQAVMRSHSPKGRLQKLCKAFIPAGREAREDSPTFKTFILEQHRFVGLAQKTDKSLSYYEENNFFKQEVDQKSSSGMLTVELLVI